MFGVSALFEVIKVLRIKIQCMRNVSYKWRCANWESAYLLDIRKKGWLYDLCAMSETGIIMQSAILSTHLSLVPKSVQTNYCEFLANINTIWE